MNCSYLLVLTVFMTALAVIKPSNAAVDCTTVDFNSGKLFQFVRFGIGKLG